MVNEKVKKVSRMLCLWGLALSSVGVFAADAPTQPQTLEESVTAERKRQYVAIDADLTQAANAWDKGDYETAEKAFLAGKAKLDAKDLQGTAADKRRSSLQKTMQKFYRNWAKSLMRSARREGAAGKYDAAVVLAGRAALLCPDIASEAESFTASCREQQKADGYTSQVKLENIKPGSKDAALRIQVLFRQARKFFSAGRYEEARTALESIYLLDPFNLEATNMLDMVYQKMLTAGENRRRADISLQYTDNEFHWSEPVFLENASGDTKLTATVKQQSSGDIMDKMENIIFPSIEFEDAEFTSVKNFLQERSRVYDPEKVGVSIDLSWGNSEKALLDLPRVSMNFSNIPLSEVLRYLCKQVNLSLNVDGNHVTLEAFNQNMRNQTFRVRSDFLSGIVSSSGGLTTGATSDNTKSKSQRLGVAEKGVKAEDIFDIESETSDMPKSNKYAVSSEAVKKFFEDRGIQFPEGATIGYDSRTNSINAKNTDENLRRLDDLIRQLNKIDVPLVMVELKVIEIQENDWQELGFEWAFSAWQVSGLNSVTDSGINYNSNQSSAWAVTQPIQPLRNGNTTAGNNTKDIKLLNDFKIFPNFGNGIIGDTQFNVALSINALNQNSRTEVLSSPKVVTTSGKPARIKMTKQYYFPESWQAPTVNTNSDYAAITEPIPTFTSDPTDVGILFNVTPTVASDNYTIMLDMEPDIAQYIGNTDDIVTIEQGWINPDGSQTPWANGTRTFNVWMPNITHRRMKVCVNVYDGETIVLGGMIDNKHEVMDDRWPLLGDIPLLGRLFASQYDKKVRTNMLLFVTARLINNDGVPVRRSLPRGIPDFNR